MNAKNLRYKLLPKRLVPIADEVYRKSRIASTHVRYGLPAKNLRVIAVTGTNGKTSTCNFLNDILKTAGYKTALFTTAVIELSGERTLNKSHRTVPLTADLFGMLKKAKNQAVDFVILETTSQALQQHKLWGIPVEIAVMTNLTQDHLDYHKTMERYAAAKARLFSKYLNPKWCVLNSDDSWFEYYKGVSVGQIATYGTSPSTTTISSLKNTVAGLTMRLDTSGGSIVANAPVIGEFNAYNIAAAATVAQIIGIAPDKIRKGIESINPVPGRMELIAAKSGFTAVVDYAHTPDALEKALLALKPIAKHVSVVFGATGNRDTTKRPIMGEIAARLADKIYLTDEESYQEDEASIRAAIMVGIKKAKGSSKTKEIGDRLLAIETALREAKKGDMILISGLGHQSTRTTADGEIEWQESEVVKKSLKKLGL